MRATRNCHVMLKSAQPFGQPLEFLKHRPSKERDRMVQVAN
jgi:hypothetical protein